VHICILSTSQLFIVVTKTECVKFFMLLLSNFQKAIQLIRRNQFAPLLFRFVFILKNYKLVLMRNCLRITINMNSNDYNVI